MTPNHAAAAKAPVQMADLPAAQLLTVLYLRVSTEDQRRKGFSLPEQKAACLEHARALARDAEKELGRQVDLQTVIFTDSMSGEVLERPELEKVRAYVREHRPAYFICLDPDRFSRTTYHAILVANEIEGAGTRLEFVQHDYQNTPEGRLFFTLRVAIAEYDKAKILERTARGKRGKIASGGLPTGLNLFGYLYDKQTQEVRPHPEEAQWVTQIYQWAAHEQLGCQAIADRLNAAGIKTKRHGAKWYRGTVTKILRQRGYVGEFQVNRYSTKGLGVEKQLPKHRRTRPLTAKQNPQDEWITIRIPPLVSRELWDEVQELRRDAGRRRGVQPSYLLSALAVCGFCGGPILYRPHPSLGHTLMCANRYPYMRDLRKPEPVCRQLPHQAARIFESQVWNKIEEWLTRPETLTAYIEERRRARPADGDLGARLAAELELVERRLVDSQREQARLMAVVATGAVDPEVAAEQLRPYKDQIDHLRATSARLKERLEFHRRQGERVQSAVARIRTIQEAILRESHNVRAQLRALDDGQRNRLVRKIVRQVIIQPHGFCEIIAVE